VIETAEMLEARLALVDRVRRVEHELARDEYARAARAVLRGKAHDLGNLVQIVRIASVEIEKRAGANVGELVTDMRAAAEQASVVLTALIDVAQPRERTVGAAVAPAVRAAVELARPAIAPPLALAVELDELVATPCTRDELETIVIASALDSGAATRIGFSLRERTIAGARWVELIRHDDRRDVSDDAIERAFDAHATSGPGLALVRAIVEQAAGESSLAHGRGGLELVVALPVVS